MCNKTRLYLVYYYDSSQFSSQDLIKVKVFKIKHWASTRNDVHYSIDLELFNIFFTKFYRELLLVSGFLILGAYIHLSYLGYTKH